MKFTDYKYIVVTTFASNLIPSFDIVFEMTISIVAGKRSRAEGAFRECFEVGGMLGLGLGE